MLSCDVFNCGEPESENNARPSKQRWTLPETARPGFSGNAMTVQFLLGSVTRATFLYPAAVMIDMTSAIFP